MENFDDIDRMERFEKLSALQLFVLCVQIKNEMQSNNKRLDLGFCSTPSLRLKYENMHSFKAVMLRVYRSENAQNEEVISKLIASLSTEQIQTESEYFALIDAFGVLKETTAMMSEYEKLLSSSVRQTNDTLCCLLFHLIRHGEPQNVQIISERILKNEMSVRLNSLSLQSLILCINRSKSFHSNDALLKLWNCAMNKHKISPNLHCFCLAILSFSKYSDDENQKMAKHLLSTLESDEGIKSLLASNDLQFIQILNSYGNTGQFDKMWTFYNEFIRKWKSGKHQIEALMTLISVQVPMDLLAEILRAMSNNFDFSKSFSVDQLIVIHRNAIKSNDKRMEEQIWRILQQKDQNEKIKTNVFSHFELNGEWQSISTGYEIGGCPLDSHQKVNVLMKEIGFCVNTSVCHELPDEIAKIKHLKSHSEKKALAVLLKDKSAQKKKKIKIKVSMKMCADCHSFFAQVSKKYTAHTIECVDPKKIHIFQNGQCLSCE